MNGFAVITSKTGTKEIFYIIKEEKVNTIQLEPDAPPYERVDGILEKNILSEFYLTLGRKNDNRGTGYEIWKTPNFKFILSYIENEWQYRRVEYNK